MSQTWYFKINNIEVGPLDSKSFLGCAKEGRVKADTLVKLGDDGEWTEAKNVDGLFPELSGKPSSSQQITPSPTENVPPSLPSSESTPPQASTTSMPYTPGTSKEMQGTQIVCPHCWGKFPFEHIMYISQHSDLIGDPVIAGGEEQQRFLPTRFTPEGHAIDSRGMTCPDMACPHCHLRIPQTIMDLSSIFFSIIGAPASGKSYFMTSMVWALRNQLSSLFNFAFTDADPQANSTVNGYEQQLFLNSKPEEVTFIEKTQLFGDLYNLVRINDMDVSLPMPFIYKLQPLDDDLDDQVFTRNLILYDNAGEHFQPGREEVSQPATKHLVQSNGLIFLFDPSIDARMRLKCKNDDPQIKILAGKVTNQETLLAEMIRRIRLYSGMKTTDKYDYPLIISVAKYDLWKDEFPDDLEKIKPWVQDEEEMSFKFDFDTLLNVSYHMRSMLVKIQPSFVRTAEAFAKKVFFIPSSSFGCFSEIDEKTGGLGIRPENINSIWTEVPILLLLAEQGYIPIHRGETKGTEVTKFKIKKDAITFTVPETQELVQLPKVYFGASLYHVETEKWFSLPGEFSIGPEEEELDDDDFWNQTSQLKKIPSSAKPVEKKQVKEKKPADEAVEAKPKELPPIPGLESGLSCGDFRLIKKLGSGAMGEVWLANQETMNREVALKILSRDYSSDKEFIDRFMKEAKNSAKLVHPNIVTAFHAGQDKGLHYLAISYVEGETVEDKIKIDGPFDEKNALQIVRDIAAALDYAWNDAKMIHRDIKPANIIINKKNVPMLLDMGISKIIDDDSSLTMAGMVVGTPYYISPEQALSEVDLDFHSDIYSLGITLYHMVTGSVPYCATTAMAVLMKHVSDEFPPPNDRNPDVSENCSKLLEIMMQKDKGKRQKSWPALIKDIELVIDGKPPQTDL